ncbi:hypothetical protein HDU92_000183 [Lobulomyces angularis]|nr:hypothetical protein HDU92_000183 [Lobulomyces angularis]
MNSLLSLIEVAPKRNSLINQLFTIDDPTLIYNNEEVLLNSLKLIKCSTNKFSVRYSLKLMFKVLALNGFKTFNVKPLEVLRSVISCLKSVWLHNDFECIHLTSDLLIKLATQVKLEESEVEHLVESLGSLLTAESEFGLNLTHHLLTVIFHLIDINQFAYKLAPLSVQLCNLLNNPEINTENAVKVATILQHIVDRSKQSFLTTTSFADIFKFLKNSYSKNSESFAFLLLFLVLNKAMTLHTDVFNKVGGIKLMIPYLLCKRKDVLREVVCIILSSVKSTVELNEKVTEKLVNNLNLLKNLLREKLDTTMSDDGFIKLTVEKILRFLVKPTKNFNNSVSAKDIKVVDLRLDAKLLAMSYNVPDNVVTYLPKDSNMAEHCLQVQLPADDPFSDLKEIIECTSGCSSNYKRLLKLKIKNFNGVIPTDHLLSLAEFLFTLLSDADEVIIAALQILSLLIQSDLFRKLVYEKRGLRYLMELLDLYNFDILEECLKIVSLFSKEGPKIVAEAKTAVINSVWESLIEQWKADYDITGCMFKISDIGKQKKKKTAKNSQEIKEVIRPLDYPGKVMRFVGYAHPTVDCPKCKKLNLKTFNANVSVQNKRGSVMIEVLLPSYVVAARYSFLKISGQMSDKDFYQKHIQEIDTRDEKIKNYNLLLQQLKDTEDENVLKLKNDFETSVSESNSDNDQLFPLNSVKELNSEGEKF